MPLAHRLYQNGTLATNGQFNEFNYNTIKFTKTDIGASEIDEVTFSGGVQENYFNNGFRSAFWSATASCSFTYVATPLDPVGNARTTFLQSTNSSLSFKNMLNTSLNTGGFTDTTPLAFSVWFKYNGTQYIELIVDDSGSNGFIANFDILNGRLMSTGVNTAGKVISTKIINYGNGWFRCFVCGTVGAGPKRTGIILSDNSSAQWYPSSTIASGLGVYMYGPQLNTYGWPTPYWDTLNNTSYLANSNSFRIDKNSNLYVINGTMDEVTIIS